MEGMRGEGKDDTLVGNGDKKKKQNPMVALPVVSLSTTGEQMRAQKVHSPQEEDTKGQDPKVLGHQDGMVLNWCIIYTYMFGLGIVDLSYRGLHANDPRLPEQEGIKQNIDDTSLPLLKSTNKLVFGKVGRASMFASGSAYSMHSSSSGTKSTHLQESLTALNTDKSKILITIMICYNFIVLYF